MDAFKINCLRRKERFCEFDADAHRNKKARYHASQIKNFVVARAVTPTQIQREKKKRKNEKSNKNKIRVDFSFCGFLKNKRCRHQSDHA
jgi:hypothetical protein